MPIKMKVCNPGEYNEILKKRGKIFHLFDEATKVWFSKSKSKYIYSDRLIQIMAAFRYLFKYPFRQLQGFLEDYIRYAKLQLPIPDYSTLCRRMAKMSLDIIDHRKEKTKDKVDIIIDSTGINIYHTGGGHSKENANSRKFKHHDQVRKMHTAIDCESKDCLAMRLTSGSTADSDMVPTILRNLSYPLGSLYADGAYDRKPVRQACLDRKIKQIIPPRKNSRIRKSTKKEDPYLWDERNEAVGIMHSYSDVEEGLKQWKESKKYGKRSYVEAFFSRFKLIFGFHFMARSDVGRKSELVAKINMLNQFNKLGTAKYIRAD